jgi:drug/metabolite transporter (DMT)-like permease
MRIVMLTLLAMVAFASNSLLCRLALRQTTIDAASFTFIRLWSGAIALWLIVITRKTARSNVGSWTSGLALFAYAAAFSFAYISLSAGTGALLLFGMVQATMIFWGLWKGERLSARQWFGLAIALGGLIALVFPGLSAPPIAGALLMTAAGIAWGIYSLRGKGAGDPTGVTAGNFWHSVVFAAVLSMALLRSTNLDLGGIRYAIASGALASGIGYVIWYSVLPELKATTAATVQLSVPVLAAVGGILFLGESITLRLLFASLLILGGIGLVITKRSSG